tara:strand:- start:925 stop:1272 length:348 start_codon:yes stop_codon:yes gene_type:complete
MAIVQTVNADTFIRAFDEMDRSENFTTEARYALFDYYDDISEDIGEQFELDVVAICCDWSEVDAEQAASEYDYLLDADSLAECDDDAETLDYIEGVLSDETFVIRLENALLVQAF